MAIGWAAIGRLATSRRTTASSCWSRPKEQQGADRDRLWRAKVFLTDAVSSVIIRDSIVPRFKAGDMAGGIAAGADQIIAMMELPPAEAARRAQEIGAAESRRGRAQRQSVPGPVHGDHLLRDHRLDRPARRRPPLSRRRRGGHQPDG